MSALADGSLMPTQVRGDGSLHLGRLLSGTEARSALLVPMSLRDLPGHVLVLLSETEREFTAEEVDLAPTIRRRSSPTHRPWAVGWEWARTSCAPCATERSSTTSGRSPSPRRYSTSTGRSRRKRAIVERHPVVGERILSSVEFLSDVLPLVRHEHERFDGTGYPDGLAGEDIPLGSRIISPATPTTQ